MTARRRKPPATYGQVVADFIQGFCRVPKGDLAGQLMELLPFQREIINDLFTYDPKTGTRRYRRAFIGMPRGNGKSGLVSGLALYGLFDSAHVGAEVLVGAGDRQQARIIYDAAKRMVELDPILSSRLRVYRNVIEEPARGGTFRVISSDAPRAEGASPSLAILDEAHVQKNDDLYSVLSLGTSKRRNSLMLSITTAGRKTQSDGNDSLAYRLWQLGRQLESGERDDLDDFYFRWWGASDEDDPRDPATWKKANPAWGILVPPEAMAADANGGVPWDDFLTRRLNRWVSANESWLPRGAFAATRSDRRLQDGEECVLAFDGSWTHDTTCVVAVTLDGHVEPVGLWERPIDDPTYQVPIDEVEQRIREIAGRYKVLEIAADPFRWARSLQALEADGLPVVVFPQSSSRMIPATSAFRDAVMGKSMTWGGERRIAAALARHVDSATIRTDARGMRLAKESKSSGRRIDLAVAAVMGLERAKWHAAERQKAPAKVAPRVTFID